MKNLLKSVAALVGVATTMAFGAEAQAQRILIDCGLSFDQTVGTPTPGIVFTGGQAVRWNNFQQGTFAGNLITIDGDMTTIGIGA
ncbi:MAG: hypothetical protein AAGH64_10765, partial [Planctomycetota bacterium]